MASGSRGWSSGGTEFLRMLLILLALVALAAGALAGLEPIAATVTNGGTIALWHILYALTCLCGGLIGAIGLLWMASVLRLLGVQIRQAQLAQGTLDQVQSGILLVERTVREQGEAIRSTAMAGAMPAIERPVASAVPVAMAPMREHHAPAAMADDAPAADMLRQVRDLLMMSEAQRRVWAGEHFGKKKDALVKAIEREIDTNQWDAALAHVKDLKATVPEDPIGEQMATRVEQEKAGRARQDIEAARVQLRHLMSITAWPQAEEVVARLVQRYPATADVQALADEVGREKAVFDADNLQRLILDLKDATEHRQWRRAMAVADDLLKRYPADKRVEKLLKDYPTIKDNAETQERKEEETLFTDLMHRQRYDDAQVVAERVMAKYPTTKLAGEFSRILPKVRELIQQEKMKRQAVED